MQSAAHMQPTAAVPGIHAHMHTLFVREQQKAEERKHVASTYAHMTWRQPSPSPEPLSPSLFDTPLALVPSALLMGAGTNGMAGGAAVAAVGSVAEPTVLVAAAPAAAHSGPTGNARIAWLLLAVVCQARPGLRPGLRRLVACPSAAALPPGSGHPEPSAQPAATSSSCCCSSAGASTPPACATCRPWATVR